MENPWTTMKKFIHNLTGLLIQSIIRSSCVHRIGSGKILKKILYTQAIQEKLWAVLTFSRSTLLNLLEASTMRPALVGDSAQKSCQGMSVRWLWSLNITLKESRRINRWTICFYCQWIRAQKALVSFWTFTINDKMPTMSQATWRTLCLKFGPSNWGTEHLNLINSFLLNARYCFCNFFWQSSKCNS